MSYLRRISFILCLTILSFWGHAQFPVANTVVSNLRQKVFKITADSIKIDTISLVPKTFSIVNVAPSDYRLDFINAMLYWIKKPAAETITVTYRVFPFRLNPVAQRMNYDSLVNFTTPFAISTVPFNEQRGMFDFGTLKAEGSLGRQIGFGTTQDAVVNSSLNLQLSGMLGDSIEIQAAITDNNIPIQPDGSTQQLSEFDQVYLQFKKKNWQLNLGDIDIRQNQTYFLNFYKRLQGISFQTTNRISKDIVSKTLASGSIAKGKFTRNIIDALEGNQGPYRLKGANNEFFFIILANTERVFLDGQLLQRGEDQDYVINYNSAEISFTPKRMITKDSRIQVEFEYADRNFLNANLYLSQELEINKRLKLRFGAFSNSDAKNSSVNQVLDPKQKQFLANLGDSIQNAFYPAASLDTFAAGKILYQKFYYNAGLDSFYQYSTDPSLAKYSLSFIDLGQGNGNYVTDFNGANGKVYKFMAPVAGVKQGEFEPAQILVTPKKQQIINLGADYAIDKNTLLKTELAMSNSDVNTFSAKNKGDDRGYGAKFQLTNTRKIPSAKQLELSSGLDYEYVQSKFKPLERLRSVEFTRDWGLPLQTVPVAVDESIIKATAALKNKSNHSVAYQFTNYHRSDNYTGFQNSVLHSANWKGWRVNNEFVITNYNTSVYGGAFVRPVIDLSKQFKNLKNWSIGARYALEQNTTRNKNTDSLTADAFSFDSYSLYLKSDETKRNKYAVTFFTRADKFPVSKNFIPGDRSYNLNLQTELLSNPKRQLYVNTTFRKLKVYNAAVSNQKEDQTILGRIEYNMSEWKGLLNGNVLYETGAGQEQRRDFAYLEVPAGTGQYAWIDYNNDGIQQINEFELAAFADQAKFIRIFTPTNDFIKADFVTFNYRLDITPKALLRSPNLRGVKKFLSKLNLLTSLQTNKKSIAKGSFEFNPFKYNINDTALITLGTIINNALSFNRYSSKWGVDLSNYRRNNKSLLTYGYETNKQNDWNLKWRWNLNRSVSLTMNGKKGKLSLLTPQFSNRNYQLDIYSIEPTLILIKGTSFRLVTGYQFNTKKNLALYGGEKSASSSINIESKYNILQNSSLTAKFTVNSIDYKLPANTTVSYIMLDGLLPGKNYLWSLGFTKRLLNNLELNFQYDGRKAGVANTVHLGRAGVTALF